MVLLYFWTEVGETSRLLSIFRSAPPSCKFVCGNNLVCHRFRSLFTDFLPTFVKSSVHPTSFYLCQRHPLQKFVVLTGSDQHLTASSTTHYGIRVTGSYATGYTIRCRINAGAVRKATSETETLLNPLDKGLAQVNKHVGPPYCLAEVYVACVACCHLASHGEYSDGTDRQTDRQTDRRTNGRPLHFAFR